MTVSHSVDLSATAWANFSHSAMFDLEIVRVSKRVRNRNLLMYIDQHPRPTEPPPPAVEFDRSIHHLPVGSGSPKPLPGGAAYFRARSGRTRQIQAA